MFVLATVLTMLAPVGVTSSVYAVSIADSVCNGANGATGSTAVNCASNGNANLSSVAAKIINTFSVIIGIVAVIMIIFGGFRYITSGGSDNGVSSAKNTILYAIIGLIIVVLAQFIVRFVLNQAVTASGAAV